MLDASPVEEDELEKARRVGATMIAARPQGDSDEESEEEVVQKKDDKYSVTHLIKAQAEPKVSTFLVRSKPRYDSVNSEGNRFITNDDL